MVSAVEGEGERATAEDHGRVGFGNEGPEEEEQAREDPGVCVWYCVIVGKWRSLGSEIRALKRTQPTHIVIQNKNLQSHSPT